jgi:hypothetical protein
MESMLAGSDYNIKAMVPLLAISTWPNLNMNYNIVIQGAREVHCRFWPARQTSTFEHDLSLLTHCTLLALQSNNLFLSFFNLGFQLDKIFFNILAQNFSLESPLLDMSKVSIVTFKVVTATSSLLVNLENCRSACRSHTCQSTISTSDSAIVTDRRQRLTCI